jgi:hypothetical protein
MAMVVKLHIPVEQYGFAEFDIEVESYDDIIVEYHSFKSKLEEGGLNSHDWAKLRDTYLQTGEIDQEKWEQASKLQKYVINEIKKGIRKHG